jgi:hypothetical protein
MPATMRCCRSCPRCDDCPVLVAAAARARRRELPALATLVDEIFTGFPGRSLPAPVAQTLESLDAARHRTPAARVAA